MYSKILTTTIILILFSTAVHAEQDKTIAQLINDLEDLKPASAEKYSEINDIKEKTLLFLYGMEREKVDPDVNKFVYAVKTFIINFDSTYQLTTGNTPQDHKNAVDIASVIQKSAGDLRNVFQSSYVLNKNEPKKVVELAESLTKKFLIDEGNHFKTLADKEKVTPIKIEYIEYGIKAYNLAGENTFSLEKELEDLNSKFKEDLNIAEIETLEGDNLFNESEGRKNSPIVLGLFGLLNANAHINEAIGKYESAEKIYVDNGFNLEHCPPDYKDLYNEVNKKKNNAIESASFITLRLMMSYGIFITIITILLILFIRGYINQRKDLMDTQLNKVLKRK
ncbi:MAG: hypothetical protein A7315_02305 [Candidatus Altiarchaeales archaeon WOR_SM1_79]|nr:MAG: hypothetical protein A7315_02305 [Candidatus Altiarchaeales archaeon WOR_SM1_79]